MRPMGIDMDIMIVVHAGMGHGFYAFDRNAFYQDPTDFVVHADTPEGAAAMFIDKMTENKIFPRGHITIEYKH